MRPQKLAENKDSEIDACQTLGQDQQGGSPCGD